MPIACFKDTDEIAPGEYKSEAVCHVGKLMCGDLAFPAKLRGRSMRGDPSTKSDMIEKNAGESPVG